MDASRTYRTSPHDPQNISSSSEDSGPSPNTRAFSYFGLVHPHYRQLFLNLLAILLVYLLNSCPTKTNRFLGYLSAMSPQPALTKSDDLITMPRHHLIWFLFNIPLLQLQINSSCIKIFKVSHSEHSHTVHIVLCRML